MSEKEKELLVKIVEAFPKLDKEDQNYVLGVADGLAAAKETVVFEKKDE